MIGFRPLPPECPDLRGGFVGLEELADAESASFRLMTFGTLQNSNLSERWTPNMNASLGSSPSRYRVYQQPRMLRPSGKAYSLRILCKVVLFSAHDHRVTELLEPG